MSVAQDTVQCLEELLVDSPEVAPPSSPRQHQQRPELFLHAQRNQLQHLPPWNGQQTHRPDAPHAGISAAPRTVKPLPTTGLHPTLQTQTTRDRTAVHCDCQLTLPACADRIIPELHNLLASAESSAGPIQSHSVAHSQAYSTAQHCSPRFVLILIRIWNLRPICRGIHIRFDGFRLISPFASFRDRVQIVTSSDDQDHSTVPSQFPVTAACAAASQRSGAGQPDSFRPDSKTDAPAAAPPGYLPD